MAYIATVKILIDEADEARVYDGINEMLRNTQLGGPNHEDDGRFVDWAIGSVDETTDELDDSIANEAYAEGDAFLDWVIFSRSEAVRQDGAGFWSNEYGWTTFDLATLFDAVDRERPHSTGMDAVWMLAPYGMSYYHLILVKQGQDDDTEVTPHGIDFVCWAENHDRASEQANKANPGYTVI
ncbi:MAG: hypothetical protein Q8M09_14900 [Pseudomonadota bacterium]|nr:hypothetical protein [Pseudomonadota bacterium]MDP1905512.1 hypothetical protein [Pseudomonadota bacterium]